MERSFVQHEMIAVSVSVTTVGRPDTRSAFKLRNEFCGYAGVFTASSALGSR
jgi:hypothetical protein